MEEAASLEETKVREGEGEREGERWGERRSGEGGGLFTRSGVEQRSVVTMAGMLGGDMGGGGERVGRG